VIQSPYYALVEALTRKFRAAPNLAALVNAQFTTQPSSMTHLRTGSFA